MSRDVGKDTPFVQSLEDASTGNFLGDRTTVEQILRLAISDIMERMLTAKSQDEKRFIIESVSGNTAKIFLGRDKEYTPLHRWNQVGMIDEFVALWAGSAEVNPLDKIKHAVIKLYGEILDLDTYAATPGILNEQWMWQLDAIFSRYAGIFVGLSPAAQEALSLKPREEKIVYDEE